MYVCMYVYTVCVYICEAVRCFGRGVDEWVDWAEEETTAEKAAIHLNADVSINSPSSSL